jgi:hypothetical protein
MARNKIKAKNTRPKSNLKTGRNYAYDTKYQSSQAQIKNRASRNAARSAAVKKYGASAVKGKDVDHKDGNPRNNSPSNLKLVSKKTNRGKNKPGQKRKK